MRHLMFHTVQTMQGCMHTWGHYTDNAAYSDQLHRLKENTSWYLL